MPLLFAGFGIGALASQLGSVSVSAVSDDDSSEVGGLQNTATNLGASLGTAIAGSILIANVELAGGIPFLSDADLKQALASAGASEEVTQAVLDENEKARLDGLQAALAVLALLALLGLFFSTRIPTEQPGARRETAEGAGVAA